MRWYIQQRFLSTGGNNKTHQRTGLILGVVRRNRGGGEGSTPGMFEKVDTVVTKTDFRLVLIVIVNMSFLQQNIQPNQPSAPAIPDKITMF